MFSRAETVGLTILEPSQAEIIPTLEKQRNAKVGK